MASEQSPLPQPTLIFIPDISGFTEFVHNTEISHSQHIIEELLEEIIDANEIGLQVSEIEGDAILFYRTGAAPTAAELLAQIQRMYVRFHAHLKKYQAQRICRCGACSTANRLRLKFVLHHGELANKHVKEYTKLFGKELIVAHRLLKNSIDRDEYALFSHDLLNACSAWVDLKQTAWEAPQEGEDSYDSGPVQYCHLSLEPLMAHVPEPRIEDYHTPGAIRMMEIERAINAPLDVVFNIISDVSFRHHWIPGLKGSDQLVGKITRDGSTHRCLIKGTDQDPFYYSHSYNVEKDTVTWVESDPREKLDIVITLRRIGPKLTRVTHASSVKANAVKRAMFNLMFKKKIVREITTALENVSKICEEVDSGERTHDLSIMLAPADS